MKNYISRLFNVFSAHNVNYCTVPLGNNFPIILEYSRIFSNICEYFWLFLNTLEYFVTFWNILEYCKIFWNIPKYSTIFQNIFPLESCSRAVLYMYIKNKNMQSSNQSNMQSSDQNNSFYIPLSTPAMRRSGLPYWRWRHANRFWRWKRGVPSAISYQPIAPKLIDIMGNDCQIHFLEQKIHIESYMYSEIKAI